MKKLIMGIGLAVLAAGCQSVYKNDGGDAVEKRFICLLP